MSSPPQSVAGYFPTVSANPQVPEHQHPLALGESEADALIITHEEPPEEIEKLASVEVLDSGGVTDRARQAATLACRHLGRNDPFVTTFHYEAAAAGKLAGLRGRRWVLDCWDAPVQYRLNNPGTHHGVASRALEPLLRRAETGVHISAEPTPHTFGRQSRFLTNGAPVDRVEATVPEKSPGELRLVWLGSPRFDRGGRILVEALRYVEATVHVDVYGGDFGPTQGHAVRRGVEREMEFHGRVPPEQSLEAAEKAHAGYCVLPPREDWLFATPVKVGEYLAAGAVPLVSSFAGMAAMARGAGEYVEPTPAAVADGIERLAALDHEELEQRARAGRAEAERIAWSTIREQFVDAVQ